jgi:hypothetical protein
MPGLPFSSIETGIDRTVGLQFLGCGRKGEARRQDGDRQKT